MAEGGTASRIRRNRSASPRRGIPYGDQVYETLRSSIVDGKIAAGHRLREVDLSTRYRVSRTPVREALQRLTTEGYLTERPGVGLIVAEPSEAEIVEIYHLREVIEGLAARLAAERCAEADAIRLEALVDSVDEALAAGDERKAMALNVEFDLALFTIAASPRLHRLISELQVAQRRFARSSLQFPGRLKQSVDEHRELLKTVRGHDAQEAERLARSHMEHARAARIALSVADVAAAAIG